MTAVSIFSFAQNVFRVVGMQGNALWHSQVEFVFMIFIHREEPLRNIDCPVSFIILAKPYIKDEKPLRKFEKRPRSMEKWLRSIEK